MGEKTKLVTDLTTGRIILCVIVGCVILLGTLVGIDYNNTLNNRCKSVNTTGANQSLNIDQIQCNDGKTYTWTCDYNTQIDPWGNIKSSKAINCRMIQDMIQV